MGMSGMYASAYSGPSRATMGGLQPPLTMPDSSHSQMVPALGSYPSPSGGISYSLSAATPRGRPLQARRIYVGGVPSDCTDVCICFIVDYLRNLLFLPTLFFLHFQLLARTS